MITKNQIKHLQQLQQKKFRNIHQQFVIEGVKMVDELLNDTSWTVVEIYATKSWLELHSNRVNEHKLVLVSEQELGQISSLTNPNEVLALVAMPTTQTKPVDLKTQLVIALDNIQDPGNMGTIIRIADWFGIEHIFCSGGCVEVYNPKVIQATMGSILRVKTEQVELSSFLQQAQVPIYGALLTGESLYAKQLHSHGIILMGNESKGLTEESQQFVTQSIKIPNYSVNGSGAESLNVAIATSIICAEFRRQIAAHS